MALTTCPECGHQVSTTAPACPGCGRKRPNVGLQIMATGCLLTILTPFLLLLIAIAIGVLTSPESSERTVSTSGTPIVADLGAAVQFDKYKEQFSIINHDDFDWTDVMLRVNGGIYGTAYFHRLSRLEAHSECLISAADFVREDGAPLNPRETKVKHLYIGCDTPNGVGDHYADWK